MKKIFTLVMITIGFSTTTIACPDWHGKFECYTNANLASESWTAELNIENYATIEGVSPLVIVEVNDLQGTRLNRYALRPDGTTQVKEIGSDFKGYLKDSCTSTSLKRETWIVRAEQTTTAIAVEFRMLENGTLTHSRKNISFPEADTSSDYEWFCRATK